MTNNRNFLFFIIKILRINKGLELFNVASFMEKVKYRYSERVKKIVEEGSRDAQDKVKN
jgi:hypothetical protein